MQKQPATSVYEVIETHHHEVACDGGSGLTGHPRVYLHINRDRHDVVCPYCSCTYRLAADAPPAVAH